MDEPADRPPRTDAEGSKPEAPAASASTEDWATRYKYLLAEFDNYRKRTDREQENAQARIRGSFLRNLLPIYEAFERAREAAASTQASAEALRRGLDLLEAEWQRLLREEGVAPVAQVGQPFVPDDQEAIAETRTTNDLPDGAIAEVVQQGYRFRGGLLRPAKVVVSRAPSPTSEGASSTSAEPSTSGEER